MHIKILCSLFSHYLSAKQNPSNTVIFIAWGKDVSPNAVNCARLQDKANSFPKMPEHHLATCL